MQRVRWKLFLVLAAGGLLGTVAYYRNSDAGSLAVAAGLGLVTLGVPMLVWRERSLPDLRRIALAWSASGLLLAYALGVPILACGLLACALAWMPSRAQPATKDR